MPKPSLHALSSTSKCIGTALAVLCTALSTAPRPALADRGAFSLDGGALVSATRVGPGIGTGDSVTGTLGGATVGVRYALRNSIEITGSGVWLDNANFYNNNTTIVQDGSSFTGQFQGRVSRMGAGIGADYVTGLVFRVHAGAELGWARLGYERMDLVDVSDAANPHSFGLNLGNRTVNDVYLAPRIGLEWAATDRLSFAITPRVEFLFGQPKMTAFTIPITASYSWYGLFRK